MVNKKLHMDDAKEKQKFNANSQRSAPDFSSLTATNNRETQVELAPDVYLQPSVGCQVDFMDVQICRWHIKRKCTHVKEKLLNPAKAYLMKRKNLIHNDISQAAKTTELGWNASKCGGNTAYRWYALICPMFIPWWIFISLMYCTQHSRCSI